MSSPNKKGYQQASTIDDDEEDDKQGMDETQPLTGNNNNDDGSNEKEVDNQKEVQVEDQNDDTQPTNNNDENISKDSTEKAKKQLPEASNLVVSDSVLDVGMEVFDEIHHDEDDNQQNNDPNDEKDKQIEEKNEIIKDNPPIIIDLENEIDKLKDETVNSYTNKIKEYFVTNNIDYNVIRNMKIKDFRDNISSYCGNKKLKGKLAKLFKALKQISDTKQSNENQVVSAISNDSENKTNILELKDETKEKEQMDNPPKTTNLQNEIDPTNEEKKKNVNSGIIGDLENEIVELNDEVINANKDKIVEYFKENNIDYNVIANMKLKDFRDNISSYCGNKKIKGKITKIFKKLQEISKQTILNEDISLKRDEVNGQQEEEAKDEEMKIIDGDNPQIINDLIDEIKKIDDDTLNLHKDNVLAYFKENNIDYNTMTEMKMKQFRDPIAKYCKENKLRGRLSKLFKNMQEISKIRKEYNDSQILDDTTSHLPIVNDDMKQDEEEEYRSSTLYDSMSNNTQLQPNVSQRTSATFMGNQGTFEHQGDNDNNDESDEYQESEESEFYFDEEVNYELDEQMPTYINRAVKH